MRKEYDFSESVRRRARAHPPGRRGAASGMATYREANPVDDELTPAQIRELRRRVADLDDVTRYLLVSQMAPRFALYYNVSDDVYVMNDPAGRDVVQTTQNRPRSKGSVGRQDSHPALQEQAAQRRSRP